MKTFPKNFDSFDEYLAAYTHLLPLLIDGDTNDPSMFFVDKAKTVLYINEHAVTNDTLVSVLDLLLTSGFKAVDYHNEQIMPDGADYSESDWLVVNIKTRLFINREYGDDIEENVGILNSIKVHPLTYFYNPKKLDASFANVSNELARLSKSLKPDVPDKAISEIADIQSKITELNTRIKNLC
jgi:hypothetical protein